MSRTIFAALSSTVLVGGSLAGLGVFLGFPTAGSIWFAVVTGVASGLLLLAAGRRADSFHPTEDNAHLADHRTPVDPDTHTVTGGHDVEGAVGEHAPGDAGGDARGDAGDDHPHPRPGA